MNKYLLWGVGALVVVVLGFLLLKNNSGKQTATVPSPTAQTQASSSAQPQTNERMVNLTKAGFEPGKITIKAGTKVTWVNKSGETATINSDPHPTHTLWPFLNLGSFNDGASVSVVFDKAGTYTYHNHLNPSETGTVVVE